MVVIFVHLSSLCLVVRGLHSLSRFLVVRLIEQRFEVSRDIKSLIIQRKRSLDRETAWSD